MAVAIGVGVAGATVAVGVTGVGVAVGLAVGVGLEVTVGVGVDVTMLGGAVGTSCPGNGVEPPGGGSEPHQAKVVPGVGVGSSASAVEASMDIATALPTTPLRMRIRFFIKGLLLIRRRQVNATSRPRDFNRFLRGSN